MKSDPNKTFSDRTIYLIARIREKASRLIIGELKEHNLIGIFPSHGDILVALFMNTELTMKNMSKMIDRDKSTVTTLVDKLINLGYAKKRTDPVDNRVTLVSLTERGESLKPDFLDISRKLQERVYKTLTEPEKQTLINLLRKIDTNW